MAILLYTVHVLTSIFLILVVLLQQGKGADLSVFGGGATMTAFGARGAASLLHKFTVGGFIVFILTTLAIGVYQTRSTDDVLSGLPTAAEAAKTATPEAAKSPEAATTPEAAKSEAEASGESESEGGAVQGVLPEAEAPSVSTTEEQSGEGAEATPPPAEAPPSAKESGSTGGSGN